MKMIVAMLSHALNTLWRFLVMIVFLLSIGFNISTAALGLTWTVVASVVEAVTGVAQIGSLATKEKAAVQTASNLAEARRGTWKLNDELEFMRRKASEMEGRVAGTALRLERVAAENDSMRAKLFAQRGPKKVLFDGKERTLPEAVARVTKRVKERTVKVATADLGATVGQSIPWIGVVFVAAATTLDLQASCDNMRDMHMLEIVFDPDAANDPGVEEVCGLRVPPKEEIWKAVKESPGRVWNAAVALLPDLSDRP